MEQIGEWITSVLKDPENSKLKEDIKGKVKKLCDEFPLYKEFD